MFDKRLKFAAAENQPLPSEPVAGKDQANRVFEFAHEIELAQIVFRQAWAARVAGYQPTQMLRTVLGASSCTSSSVREFPSRHSPSI